MEIAAPIKLTDAEQNMLDMHSFVNILSVVNSVCFLIEFDLNKDGFLKKNNEIIYSIKHLLDDKESLKNALKNIGNVKNKFFEALNSSLAQLSESDINEEVKEEIENLHSIFEMVETRALEMATRLKEGIKWQSFLIDELHENFNQFFNAVEKNAKGRYRIIHNIAEKEPKDYLIHFEIKGANGKHIFMPDVMVDIMSDLLANARKYTNPGGTIDAGLSETETKILFRVKDSGIGIPYEEIPKVVEYGYRASNAEAKKTFGSGFGLTKAYRFVKENGGKFWVDSEEGEGTCVKLEIPKP